MLHGSDAFTSKIIPNALALARNSGKQNDSRCPMLELQSAHRVMGEARSLGKRELRARHLSLHRLRPFHDGCCKNHSDYRRTHASSRGETNVKKLPIPDTVRFQTSQRGVTFLDLQSARADFEAWLETGVSPTGARTSVHIWQNKKERVIERIGADPRGEILRGTIRRALRSGKLQIRKGRANRD